MIITTLKQNGRQTLRLNRELVKICYSKNVLTDIANYALNGGKFSVLTLQHQPAFRIHKCYIIIELKYNCPKL